MPIDEARKLGAMALFGEKYGEKVRVVKFGPSIELCGGTHTKRTGSIGMIKITAEASVAAGVRRIEALTGEKAEEYYDMQQDILNGIKSLFNNAPNLVATITKEVSENAELKKKVEVFTQEKISIMAEKFANSAIDVNGTKVVKISRIADLNVEMARGISSILRNKFAEEKFMFVAGLINNNKPMLLIMISKPLVDAGLNATNIVKEAAKEIGGNGGGQPFLATAGGSKAEGIDKAIEVAVNAVR
jgi:alanyl-tRNA synthetase